MIREGVVTLRKWSVDKSERLNSGAMCAHVRGILQHRMDWEEIDRLPNAAVVSAAIDLPGLPAQTIAMDSEVVADYRLTRDEVVVQIRAEGSRAKLVVSDGLCDLEWTFDAWVPVSQLAGLASLTGKETACRLETIELQQELPGTMSAVEAAEMLEADGRQVTFTASMAPILRAAAEKLRAVEGGRS